MRVGLTTCPSPFVPARHDFGCRAIEGKCASPIVQDFPDCRPQRRSRDRESRSAVKWARRVWLDATGDPCHHTATQFSPTGLPEIRSCSHVFSRSCPIRKRGQSSARARRRLRQARPAGRGRKFRRRGTFASQAWPKSARMNFDSLTRPQTARPPLVGNRMARRGRRTPMRWHANCEGGDRCLTITERSGGTN